MAEAKITLEAELLDKISKNLELISKSINNFGKTSEDSFKKASLGITALSTGFLAVTKALSIARGVFSDFTDVVKQGIKNAAEQEKAETLLANALKTRGIFTEELLKSQLKLANSLQKLTIYGDEQIIETQRILIQLGVEKDQLEAVTKATLDFASAKGISLVSAAELVGKSIGSTTNALSRYGIKIENITGSTQRANEIVRKIAELFGGSAQAEANTFAGSIAKLQNIWSDLLEELGNFIIKSPQVINGINQVTVSLYSLIDIILQNKDAINELLKSIIDLTIKGFTTLIGAISKLEPLFFVILNPIDLIQAAIFRLIRLIVQILQPIEKLDNMFRKLFKIEEQNKLTDALVILDSVIKENDKDLEKSAININKFGESTKSAAIAIEEFNKKAQSIPQIKKTELIVETKSLKLSLLDIFKEGGKLLEKAALAIQNSFKSLKATDFVSAFAGGKAGAEKVLGQALEAAGTAVGTALGSAEGGRAVGQFAGLLGKDPEEFRKITDGFIQALADFGPNIGKNAAYFIRALIRAIPEIIKGLNESLPILIEELTLLLSDPAFWESVINAMTQTILLTMGNPNFWIGVSVALAKAVTLGQIQAVDAMVQAIKTKLIAPFEKIGGVFDNLAKTFQGIIDALKGIIDSVKSAGGVLSGGVGGLLTNPIINPVGAGLKKIGKKFGFQEGGMVPDILPFANDRYGPVYLGRGENVIDRSLNKKLEEFINTAGGEKTFNISIQVGEKDLANVILSLNQRGFRLA